MAGTARETRFATHYDTGHGGGSMLSIGSAAGVALMDSARGYYTFFGHLKWMLVIALGYIGSILAHFRVNSALILGVTGS